MTPFGRSACRSNAKVFRAKSKGNQMSSIIYLVGLVVVVLFVLSLLGLR
jgi:hypothetical protein